jgi:SAM-dependent methyltransferase
MTRSSSDFAYGKEFFNHHLDGSFSSAEVTAPLLMRLIDIRSAVDVGCGVGTWLKALTLHGVHDVLGIDGAYVDRRALQIPGDRFLPLDLSQPFTLDRRFDIALSLEVAEHLAADCAQDFIDSLVRLAPVILFSAAIPFQGGTHHVNEQWPEYWADLFRNRGYLPIDCIRSQIWNDPRVEWWYAQNILLYASEEGIRENAALAGFNRSASASGLSLVHPRKYLQAVDPPPPGLRRCLSLTALSAKYAVLNKLKKLTKSGSVAASSAG